MSTAEARPYGSWPSPVTTDLLVQSAARLGSVRMVEGDVWWDEMRPEEDGRVVVVRRRAGEASRDVLPRPFSARTRAHEYGGGAWWLHGSTLFFVNWDDQRLYRGDVDGDGEPVPITRDPVAPHTLRYADGVVTPDGQWVVCVRESHEAGGEAVNELVAVPVAGGDARPLVTGPDFVSSPRISPDGCHLCWLAWDHPRMPWDGTELWTGRLRSDGSDLAVDDARWVAGGADESVFQPEWSPDGTMHFVSDRSDWWTLYRCRSAGLPEPGDSGDCLWPVEKEVGVPQWVFGMSRYAFVGGERREIVAAAASHGVDELWLLDPGPVGDPGATIAEPVGAGMSSISSLQGGTASFALVGGSFESEPAIVEILLGDVRQHQVRPRLLRPPRDLGLDPALYSRPEAVTFPTGEGVAHALFYPPTNPRYIGPEGDRPPLIVQIHGGPTAAARPQLQLAVQFWTSRGFGVVDVDYRGSSGHGRAFRCRLDGLWGVADVEDCAAAARFLAERGDVDGDRLAIHGGSAGGYTTLCALAFTNQFTAGTSSYGVADLEALARDTHKFESRYLDGLVGPYPECRDRYVERSPVHHTDQLDTPLLILQGLEDEIVPPNQAEMMAEALRSRGVPFAYLAFEDEQHGFRRAETIRRAMAAELFFYARVFGFEPPSGPPPIEIENL